MIRCVILLNVLLFLSLFQPAKVFAGGLSAWEETTPGGNTIGHDGTSGGWITLTMDTTTITFKRFYFYKGNVVATSDSSWYIANESTKRVQEFRDEATWKAAIKTQHLKPFWKREYDDHYGSDKFGMLLLLVLVPFPLFIPLLWLVCVVSLLFSYSRFLPFRKHFSWIYPVVVILVLLANSCPQSI